MKIYKIGPVLLSPTTLKYNIFRENNACTKYIFEYRGTFNFMNIVTFYILFIALQKSSDI